MRASRTGLPACRSDKPKALDRPPGLSHKRALILLIICGLPALGQTNGRPQALCAQIQPIAQQLTVISGMPLKHPVPCDFISKPKIEEFLNRRAEKTKDVSDEDIDGAIDEAIGHVRHSRR